MASKTQHELFVEAKLPTVNKAMTKEAVKTRTNTQLEYPRYNVIYNDDYTPTEFVIKLLIEVFNKNITTAKEITMEPQQH